MGGALAAIGGFFTAIIHSVAAIFATAAGLVFLIVLWRSESLPVVLSWVGIGLNGFFNFAIEGLKFLGALVTAVF